MTAMPWGQKKNSKAMIHSQTVTPPLAAIDGTTFRLKTATTKSRTRSKRPRTRFKCGGLASWVSADKSALLGPYPSCRHLPYRHSERNEESALCGCQYSRFLASLGMTNCCSGLDTKTAAELCSAGQPRRLSPRESRSL